MKWHGAWLYGVHRTCAETAAVTCGTSHANAVSTPLRWIFKKRAIKLVTTCERSESAQENGEQCYISDHQKENQACFQMKRRQEVPILLSYSVQHYEDTDTFSGCWGYFGVSIIHRTLTWTAGSLTCVCDLFGMRIHTVGPRFIVSSEGLLQSLHWI